MEQWKKEKHNILNSWPKIIYSKVEKNKLFIDLLEEKAWGISNKNEWLKWLKQIDNVWPENSFIENNEQKQIINTTEPIIYDLGMTLGQNIKQIIVYNNETNKNQKIPFITHNLHELSNHHVSKDVKNLAKQLSETYGIKEIIASNQSDNEWLKRQLLSAETGFNQICSLFNLPQKSIGGHVLSLWFFKNSIYNGSSYNEEGYIEVHSKGGDVGRTWFTWYINDLLQKSSELELHILKEWNSLNKINYRKSIQYQKNFLEKSRLSLKEIMDEVDITSDIGKKVFRRYSAFCKWIKIVENDKNSKKIKTSWKKIKTGNNIAWSHSETKKERNIAQQWRWEENFIDTVFFKAPHWNIPSWVQRYVAINHNCWSKQWKPLEINEIIQLLSLAFEATLVEHIGYSSWLAQENLCQPQEFEYQDTNNLIKKILT